MIEAEMTFAELETIINLAEKMIKYVIKYVLDNNIAELEFLENYDKENKKEVINKLKKIVDSKFKRIDYSETLEILKEKKENFVFNDIN